MTTRCLFSVEQPAIHRTEASPRKPVLKAARFIKKILAPAAVEMMEIAKSGDFTHSHRTTTTALILTFLLGAAPCHFY